MLRSASQVPPVACPALHRTLPILPYGDGSPLWGRSNLPVEVGAPLPPPLTRVPLPPHPHPLPLPLPLGIEGAEMHLRHLSSGAFFLNGVGGRGHTLKHTSNGRGMDPWLVLCSRFPEI